MGDLCSRARVAAARRPLGGTMNAVEATCGACGVVRLPATEVAVRVCADHPMSTYTFRCPECGRCAAKPANDHIVDVLTTAGALLEVWHLPEELREPRPGGAPINHDDLLDFHLLLQHQDWFERLAQLVAGATRDLTPPESRRRGRSPSRRDWRSRPSRRGPRYGL